MNRVLAPAILVATLCAACAPPADDLDDDAAADEALDDGKADGDGRNVLYLNFSGGTFKKGDCDDARTNCSNMVPFPETLVPAFDTSSYGGAAARTRILAGVRAAFAGLNVRITTRRPAAGSYHMIVVGGKALDVLGMWVLGRAGLGCGNGNKNAIGFVTPFFDERRQPTLFPDIWHPSEPFFAVEQRPTQREWQESEAGIIRAIAHEAGHGYGLVHTAGFSASYPRPADIMCEEGDCRTAGGFEFKRALMNLDRSQGRCGDSTTLSSYETLAANLR